MSSRRFLISCFIAALIMITGLVIVPAFADPPFGPSMTVTDGITTLNNAHKIKYTAGCVQTNSGSTAQESCRGGGGAVAAPVTIADSSTDNLGNLLDVTNHAGSTHFLTVSDNASLVNRSNVADSGTAIGTIMDTVNSFATAGDAIAAFENAGTIKSLIDSSGTLVCSASCAGAAGNGSVPANAAHQARMIGGNGGIGFVTLDDTNGFKAAWNNKTTIQADGTNVILASTATNGQVLNEAGVAVEGVTVNDVNYTSVSTDFIIGYSAITAARTVTVQDNATQAALPRLFIIKDQSGSASATNTITVKASSGNVDGAASKLCVSAAYGSCHVYCDGTNCFLW